MLNWIVDARLYGLPSVFISSCILGFRLGSFSFCLKSILLRSLWLGLLVMSFLNFFLKTFLLYLYFWILYFDRCIIQHRHYFSWDTAVIFIFTLCMCLSTILLWCRHPCSSNGKESACSAGDPGLIPESERSSGEGNGNPLQYSCLENPIDREAWRATVHGFAKSWTWLSN